MAIYSEHCITKRVPWGSYSQERNPRDPLLSRSDCRETDNLFFYILSCVRKLYRACCSHGWKSGFHSQSLAECVVFSCTNAEWLICVLVA